MELLIEYYKSDNAARNQEYIFCIEKNLKNKFIDKVHVFIDDINTELEINSDKLNVIRIEKRNTYSDFFNYANFNLQGKKVILANTDIFFDETLEFVENFTFNEVVLSLTRWDYNMNTKNSELYYVDMSQDCWMFQTPMNVNGADFLLGKPGCDNRISFLFHEAGLDVRNPAMQIKTHHVHDSKYRTYTTADTVAGWYMTLLPNNNINSQTYKRIIESF